MTAPARRAPTRAWQAGDASTRTDRGAAAAESAASRRRDQQASTHRRAQRTNRFTQVSAMLAAVPLTSLRPQADADQAPMPRAISTAKMGIEAKTIVGR